MALHDSTFEGGDCDKCKKIGGIIELFAGTRKDKNILWICRKCLAKLAAKYPVQP